MSIITGPLTQTPHLNQKGSAGWSWPRLVKSDAVAPAITAPSVRPSSIHSSKSSNKITSPDPNLQSLPPVPSELDLTPLPAVVEQSDPEPPPLASSVHGFVTTEEDSRLVQTPKSIHQPQLVKIPSMASSIHGSIHGSVDMQPPQIPTSVHQPGMEPSSTVSSIHDLPQGFKEIKPPYSPQLVQQPMTVRPPSVTSSRRGSMDGSIDGTRSVHIIQLVHRSSISRSSMSKAPSVLESLHEPGEMELPPLPESPYKPSITDFPQVVESESAIFDTSPPESRVTPDASASKITETMDSPLVSPTAFKAPRSFPEVSPISFKAPRSFSEVAVENPDRVRPEASISKITETMNSPVVPPIAFKSPQSFPEAAAENPDKVRAEAIAPPMPSKRVALAASATLPPPKIMILRATEDDDVADEPLARYPTQSRFEFTQPPSTKLSSRPGYYHGSDTESMDHLPEMTRSAQGPSTQRVRKRKLLVRKTRRAILRGPVLRALLGRELASQTQPVLKMMATGGGDMEVDSASAVG